MIKSLSSALLLCLATLTLLSCGTTPTSPVTGDPNGPIFLAAITRQSLDGAVTFTACQVSITSAQLTPVPGCSVTLVAPGPVTVVLAEGATGYFSDIAGSWAYTPGSTYTINARVNGTNYSGNIQASGGVAIPASGTPASWTHEGTIDTVTVLETSPTSQSTYNSVTITTNLNSPHNLPGSAYPEAGNYLVQANIVKLKTSAFGSGAHPGASLTATDQVVKTITIP